MKAMIHVPAFALHEDGEPIDGINRAPTDATYEARCLQFDAQRAWKMREPLERALSWRKGSAQHGLWMEAYREAQVRWPS